MTTADVKQRRMYLVDYWHRRGKSVREIVALLPSKGEINHDTGEPWSIGTVQNDIRDMAVEWADLRDQMRERHLERQLSRLELLYASSLNDQKYTSKGEPYPEGATIDTTKALDVLKEESKLLGIYPDPRVEIDLGSTVIGDPDDPALKAAYDAYIRTAADSTDAGDDVPNDARDAGD
jgi:hypothetical protein